MSSLTGLHQESESLTQDFSVRAKGARNPRMFARWGHCGRSKGEREGYMLHLQRRC